MNRKCLSIVVLMYVATSMAQTITDFDANVYNTIVIGSQTWMKENLKVSHYQNGVEIPMVTDDIQWSSTKSGASCNYANSSIISNTYGKIYNFYAVENLNNICPIGWHVPSDKEWDTLIAYLGGAESAGGLLKSTNLWNLPNIGASDNFGFSALPGGGRSGNDGAFLNLNNTGFYWSSTDDGVGGAWIRILSNTNSSIIRGNGNSTKNDGFYVRCIKDSVITSIEDRNIVKPTNIYPNITTDIFYFENNSLNEINIDLFDLHGKKVNQYYAKTGLNVFNLSGATKGFYFLQYICNSQLKICKICKH